MTLKATKTIEIRFCEVDQLQIVWHGHYLKYFEDAREVFSEKYKLNFRDFIDKGYYTYMSKYEVEHKRPLLYGDKAMVEITYQDSITCKIIFRYKIYNSKNQITCIGKTEQVMVNSERKLMIDWPDFLKEWKKQNILQK